MLKKSPYVALILIALLNIVYLVWLADELPGWPLLVTTVGSAMLALIAVVLLVLAEKEAKAKPSQGPAETVVRPPKAAPEKKPEPPKPARSDAITLLATLQREARFVDFVKESLDGYSDAQIGAVAREVHRDCGQVIERLFAPAPLVEAEEASTVDVPAGFDPGRFRLTGNVTGEGPFTGKLAHHGWKAAKCEVPAWSGTKQSSLVVAPAEVEL